MPPSLRRLVHEELDAGFAVVDGVAVVAVVTSNKAGAIGVVERAHGAAATLAAALDAVLEMLLGVAEGIYSPPLRVVTAGQLVARETKHE